MSVHSFESILKKFSSTIVFLCLIVVAGEVAQADCVVGGNGRRVCGSGACIASGNGGAACYNGPYGYGQCTVGGNGQAACGAGQCETGGNGSARCSRYPDGQCFNESNGTVTCTEDYGVQPRNGGRGSYYGHEPSGPWGGNHDNYSDGYVDGYAEGRRHRPPPPPPPSISEQRTMGCRSLALMLGDNSAYNRCLTEANKYRMTENEMMDCQSEIIMFNNSDVFSCFARTAANRTPARRRR